MRRVPAAIAILSLLLLAQSRPAQALSKTCLTGADPSVAVDADQIKATRVLVDAGCPCAKYDGTPGWTHGDYVRCASGIIVGQTAGPPSSLRRQCVGTVRKIYSRSTCGYDPALHVQPCVKKSSTSGAVTCSIKPTTLSDGATPTARCRATFTVHAAQCPGFAHCLDAGDIDGDQVLSVADSGDCAPVGGASRPVSVHVPPGYVPGTPTPLLLLLHGYTASGALEDFYLQMTAQSDARGFLYAYPDGTVDQFGNRFWNATPACCDIFNTGVDDSGYLSGVIASISAIYSVDPKRVYIMGHSNGAFMAYRMACDHADQIAAIASLAGAMFDDVAMCMPAAPVSVVEIHGTADDRILYDGGNTGLAPYPAAPTTVGDWVALNGCANSPDVPPPLDLESTLAGAETTVTRYATGCTNATAAELWTISGGGHIPSFTSEFDPDVIDFLYAHPKP